MKHNEVGHKEQRAWWRARRWRERSSHDKTSASKGHRRQVSTSIACLYDYCAESATKTNTLIDSYTATGREVRASFALDLFKLHSSRGNLIFSIRYHIRATRALYGPSRISPSLTCLSRIHATGAFGSGAPTSCSPFATCFSLIRATLAFGIHP